MFPNVSTGLLKFSQVPKFYETANRQTWIS